MHLHALRGARGHHPGMLAHTEKRTEPQNRFLNRWQFAISTCKQMMMWILFCHLTGLTGDPGQCPTSAIAGFLRGVEAILGLLRGTLGFNNSPDRMSALVLRSIQTSGTP